ncbi:MAG: ATP-binding protein [Pseudomonadota bacterium]
MAARKRSGIYLFLLIIMVVGIGLLHSFTPGDRVFLHETYRRLSYFPIVVAALLYGTGGGVMLALFTILSFVPHLHLFHNMNYDFFLGELTEIALYLAAGIVVGTIAGRESRLKEKYQVLSEKLEKSYTRLHEEAELLLEAEEQLRVSQKFSALGQLSASLAHEIKNPLGSIKGTAEIFLDEFPPGHPKREFVEILLKETARLNTTVEEVLRYSKNQQQCAAQKESMESVSVVLDHVLALLDNKIRKKNIRITRRISPERASMLIDGNKMSQVFINLLLNAIEAIDRGGEIRIDGAQSGDDMRIIVSDNGPGIPPEERDKIFTPFYSGREDGTGLGLAISAKIVESYGGRIELAESPEGGASFTIVIPCENSIP